MAIASGVAVSLMVWNVPGHAQALPDDARGFVAWCRERGLTEKDLRGWSCSDTIAFSASMTAGFSKTSKGCQALKEKGADLHKPGAFDAMPVYQWLLDHPAEVRGSATAAINAAVKALYKCPE